MRRTSFAPTRRRRSFAPAIFLILLLLVVGLLVYAWAKDSEVPTAKVEQDVTNEVLAR
jgi:ABC-type transporter Mla subunit MlaD